MTLPRTRAQDRPERPPLLARELLADHDYRHYWLGSTAFALGIWGFLISMGVSARVLTDSPLRVSLVSVAYFLPMFVLALPSGVLADAVDRRKTVMVSRSVSAAGAFVLAALTAGDWLTYGALLALCALTGATVVSEVAARQAYVTQVVKPDQVVGATALGSVQGGLARVLGPLVAGWLIGRWGQSAGYLFFAATNLACVAVFLRIRASGVPVRTGGRPVAELVEGLRYLRRTPDALAVVAVAIGTGVFGWVYLALMPIVATDSLAGGAFTLGLLSTAVGLGSVPPSVVLAVRTGGPRREGRLFYLATFAWAAGVVVFGLSSSLALSLVALTVAGAGNGLQQVLMRTLLMRLTDPAFHGRVLGTLMLTWGANVLGTLGGGALAEAVGVGPVIVLSGGLIAGVALAVLVRRSQTWQV